MPFTTCQEIVQDVILEAGLVTGSSVQTYTEPTVIQAVNRMFQFLWNKQKWSHLWDWQTGTVDGSTGKLTTALTGVTDYTDIGAIRYNDRSERAVVESTNTEHLRVVGGDALYYTVLPWDDDDAETKFLKFWPIASTTELAIHCGHKPNRFVGASEKVPFDRDIITLGTLWYSIAADGLNPSAAEVAQGMFDLAFTDYCAKNGAKEIGHGRGYSDGTFRIG